MYCGPLKPRSIRKTLMAACHPLGGQRCAVVNQHAALRGVRPRDHLAGHANRLLGHRLGLAQPLDFVRRFLAPFAHTHIEIAVHRDPRLAQHVSETQRQSPIGGDFADTGTAQAFRGGLGSGHFTISGKAAFRGEVSRHHDSVGLHCFLCAFQFDVAHQAGGGDGPILCSDLEEYGGVAHRKLQYAKQRAVVLGNARSNRGK